MGNWIRHSNVSPLTNIFLRSTQEHNGPEHLGAEVVSCELIHFSARNLKELGVLFTFTTN